MYQKSPLPYLLILVGIVTISCFTNLTIDKEIEEPIVHVIKKETKPKKISIEKTIEQLPESEQLAVNR